MVPSVASLPVSNSTCSPPEKLLGRNQISKEVSSTVPTADFLYGDILSMPDISKGYLRIFAPPSLRTAGLDVDEMHETLRSMTQEDLEEFLAGQMEGFPRTLDDLGRYSAVILGDVSPTLLTVIS